ncbi:glycosyltransferase family 4 protein [Candidatus Peregrinibacteria bacterium CG_4_10_14_0_2_um_filter_43_11]|nr:MAG: glycosyltransferase family 4 protein [Candidatus Peregrinibacteria bacterium CG_4_10_14_0_2_um_filter_43_11]
MNIAIITDWLTNYGGAESVISAFHDLFPKAPIYTTMYKPKDMRELGAPDVQKLVKTSWLQNIPFVKHQWMLGQMPVAVEMMDLDDYDIVLSSCHSVSKGVITKPNTLHICYCHTPMRYAWEEWDLETRLKKFPKILHGTIRKQIKKIREWDYCAAQRVDKYIANSSHIAWQIQKHYGRDADVIYPPVHTEKFKPAAHPKNDYYFSIGRLIPYKKFDLLVETFNQLGLKLKIAGTGPDLQKIKAMAKGNVEILGSVSDAELADLYANCRGLLFPQIEDAGIVPLEAMSAGRPVIALSRGGSLDVMEEGKTGVFFEEQTVESLTDAIQQFEKMDFDSHQIREHAMQFDVEVFKRKIKEYIDSSLPNFNKLEYSIDV